MRRRRYSPEKKVNIIREHLEKNISIPDICEKYSIHPNQFYRWKKELFEGAVETFTRNKNNKFRKGKVSKLEERLKERNEVIAELLQENIKLKNESGEI
jgi:transposase-like protein